MTIELPRTPSFRLDGRRALITGGGRGIGLAAAAALAEAGAHVTLTARTSSEIEDAAESIRSDGGSADAIVLDMLDTAAMRSVVETADPFDILINNAGTNRPKTMLETTEDDFDAVLDLNLRAAYFVAQAVTDKMLAAKIPGSVINISSQMGHVGGPLRTVYCSSKWAIEGLTKSLAMELGSHGIRVNSIAPTFIETPLAKEMLKDPAFREAVLSKIKLSRTGQVEDLMGAIVFLASDAAAMITGASLLVDGGWTIG
ncbi:MAG: glucose 1-dehydrogenase [Pseudomonadota bacterium]|nr:glucose 1-dehydrogenase [Pseudomonadota bacterium]MEC8138238.1 glucose 1-dehydrogenase [Pseudomonadota bacterium]MEC8698683.1 glucose 1-dehydrogenase [Pseudomonadota bacterium]MEC8775368.1 glucose 1-dehydrogenase [Pseudomonadota bacterium]